MHNEAFAWVRDHADLHVSHVLDIGGRDINGTTRGLFTFAGAYRVMDVLPGPGVDIVADAGTWEPDDAYDVVVCTEVFEHTANWRDIIATAFAALVPGGQFVATMAGPGRPEHSAIDGGWSLHPGEHYGNVTVGDLEQALTAAGFVDVLVDSQERPADSRCTARRPAAPDGGA